MPSIISSVFHFRRQSYLFHKSFLPYAVGTQGLPSRVYWTVYRIFKLTDFLFSSFIHQAGRHGNKVGAWSKTSHVRIHWRSVILPARWLDLALLPRRLKARCRRDTGCAGRGSGNIFQRSRQTDCRHDRGVAFVGFLLSAPQRSKATQRRFRHWNFSFVGKTGRYFYLWMFLLCYFYRAMHIVQSTVLLS